MERWTGRILSCWTWTHMCHFISLSCRFLACYKWERKSPHSWCSDTEVIRITAITSQRGQNAIGVSVLGLPTKYTVKNTLHKHVIPVSVTYPCSPTSWAPFFWRWGVQNSWIYLLNPVYYQLAVSLCSVVCFPLYSFGWPWDSLRRPG